MSVFSDLDIDRQERAQADKAALVYLAPADMKAANRRTDAFLHGGLDDALGRLYRAGHAVASVTQALGKRKHGPLWSRPGVYIRDAETVVVSYRRVRPQTRAVLRKHFTIAKRSEWPKALRK